MAAGDSSQSNKLRLINRRTLIQAGGGTALAAVALGERFFARPHFTTAQAISTIAADMHQRGRDFAKGDMPAGAGFSSATAERGLTVEKGLRGAQYVSPVIKVDFGMTHVGPHWDASYEGGWFDLEVRLSKDGTRWTEWTPVTIETWEHDDERPGVPGVYGNLINSFGADRVQYRAHFDTTGGPVSIRRMTMTCMNVNDGPTAKVLVPSESGNASASPYIARPTIITRAAWGCNESYRFDSNGNEIWGKEYKRWKAIVPHHTATTNNYWNSAEQIRGFYYYHAITHGWGDIGYHALVGNDRSIYEGRKSAGSKVLQFDLMAGHVLQCNAGSFGFAFIGDFSYVYIPSGMLRAGRHLAAYIAAERDIHPKETIAFQRRDGTYYRGPAVAAHRLMQNPYLYPTACPGDTGYSQFPWFRQYIQDKLDAAPEKTPVPGTATPTPSPKRYTFTGSGRSANSTASTLAWDGMISTYWATTSTTPPSSARIYFDLGAIKYVSRIRWLFQRAWADWCMIEWSNDKITWKFLADASDPGPGVWDERIVRFKLRYVRFVFRNPNNEAKLGGLAEVQCYP
jgi:hypothetical protein